MRNVVIGFLGTQLDMGKRRRWRPTVDLCRTEGFPVDRLELIHDHKFNRLAHSVKRDIEEASPETEVLLHRMDMDDPWDLEEVYTKLFDFASDYGFDEDRERYHIHLTTGTHVGQICWFLLSESRHIPAALIQTGPPRGGDDVGTFDLIDLDLSRYDALQQRFDQQTREYGDLLKGGIKTRNVAYNRLIDRIEQVAGLSDAPILLQGESGTGKSELAQRIYELKLQRRRVKGRLVHVNCATLRGGTANATLFGQRRSFTGQAGTERAGLLREADGGVLFLDEIDALGLEEQALLLHAIEAGQYYPLGSDAEVTSRFQVIAGASGDLSAMVSEGVFRIDLLTRLNLWTFHLPALRDRPEDFEVNLRHELAQAEKTLGIRVGFNSDASEAWLRFASAPGTLWPGNFRDFSGAILRLCTLAPRGRITRAQVVDEIATLERRWRAADTDQNSQLVAKYVNGPVDPFDIPQLANVLHTCQTSATISEAGRRLFAVSREDRKSRNDADRLRKYLAKFDLSWAELNDG
ncbi:transcriptional regulatory protein RtcR [Litoreibacter ascidiaceicola]|uniref:Transcriptional regulatory protein RtcR n=2 Tax=Litoreibacter ascidiaceicola TaxID=1486859 RepID=A0A1M5E537_9RHOB|nr:RNA repair transcriptional activator RtcR [Litoreibacter ascidiaceicola]SHF74358.1 transcriptional regulatory protein RtcR [Litoreibacter ascidiaceicola]